MLSASKSGSGLATGYNLTRSLRFRASASAYLNRTFTTPTNNKIWTYSFWAKRGQLGAFQQVLASRPTSTPYSLMYFGDTDNFQFDDSGSLYFATSQLFRDVASWYHIVVAVDTTQATSTNRFKLYVNGAQVTAFSSTTYPAQNYNTQLNTASSHAIGKGGVFTTNYLDGYLTEVNFIDGQALTPSSFGSTNALTGVWQPARYTGTYGTNGFYLPFTDNSALTTSSNVGLGKDFSGNGNYWTTNNISITAGVTYDSMTDVPTLTSATAANFAVLNPLLSYSGSGIVFSNGNLTALPNYSPVISSIGSSSGKYYCEVTSSGGGMYIGIVPTGYNSGSGIIGGTATSYAYASNATKYNNGVTTAYGASYASGDVIGVALDMDSGSLTFYKNNVSQGVAFTGITGTNFFAFLTQSTTITTSINFGQQPFSYTPPTGFVALNAFNLPTSTILAGNKVMDATLFTPTSGANTITNAGAFKPDLVWIKARSNVQNHYLIDSVRGGSALLRSNTTDAESTATAPAFITSFNSNGFSTDTASLVSAGYNYVGWQWQAGQGSTSSNTNGTITSTVSVNASAGFSVATFTCPASGNFTWGHGLGVAPAMFIVKSRSSASTNWGVYHQNITSTPQSYFMQLNTTVAAVNSTTTWANTAPTSSVISMGTNTICNPSDTAVCYAWTPIAGFSAFGSYTGNGSTSGPFIYTGFQPKYILIKRTDTTDNWYIKDSARNPYNSNGNTLLADSSSAEFGPSNTFVNFLSNGINLVTTSTGVNASGGTYIYAAFASNPFKNSLAF